MNDATEELRGTLRAKAAEVQSSIDRLLSSCDMLPDGVRAMAREGIVLALNLGYTQCEIAVQRGVLAARPKPPEASKVDS